MGLIDKVFGLKGKKTKSTSKVLNETAMNIVQRKVNSCKSAITQRATIKFGDVTGGFRSGDFTSTQGASIDLKCVMKATTQADIQKSLANMLADRGRFVFGLHYPLHLVATLWPLLSPTSARRHTRPPA